MRRGAFKSVELNLLQLTSAKQGELSSLFAEYATTANEILSTLRSERPGSETRLHHLTYNRIRKMFRLPAQLVCAARLEAWAKRNHKVHRFRHLPICYNVPRSGSLRETRRGNPILSVASLNGRLGLPVARDGAWGRLRILLLDGWTFTEFRLLNMNVVRVTLRKRFEVAEPAPGQTVLGIDVGVSTLAALTIFGAAGVERQFYVGREVSQVKRDLGVRRSKLQAHMSQGSRRARRALQRLRGYERRFDKTRCFQEAHRIVNLAKRYSAAIAMEDLRGLQNEARPKIGPQGEAHALLHDATGSAERRLAAGHRCRLRQPTLHLAEVLKVRRKRRKKRKNIRLPLRFHRQRGSERVGEHRQTALGADPTCPDFPEWGCRQPARPVP